MMSTTGVLVWLKMVAKSLFNAVVEAAPPYRRIEGQLTGKKIGPEGKYFVIVDSEMVEVDRLTFDTLEVGEGLRIRSTRKNQAISIDRLIQ